MWCFNPFGRDDHCFFGWTASNDRRENVWMLVSSLCIPSFYKYNLACRSTGNINWWKRTCLSYHSHSISCFCWITHHHGDSVRLLYPIIKSERVYLHFHVSCCLGIWNPVRWMSYRYATSTRMMTNVEARAAIMTLGEAWWSLWSMHLLLLNPVRLYASP